MMAEQERQRALADEILSDARRQAERKVGRAERRANGILSGAQSQADTVRAEAVAAAEARADQQAATILADVPHQEQARALRVKDEAVGRLFADALDATRALREDEMLSVLVGLSAEAIALMPGNRFVLCVGAADAERFGDKLAAQIAAQAGKTKGGAVDVQVVPHADVTGGVIVRSADGPERVDNSFAERARRELAKLRSHVAQMIYGDASE